MLSNTFKTEIENYSFTKQGINSIKDCGDKGEDWPVVYILSGDKEAYVGETQSAFQRMTQHLANPKRKQLTKISLMLSDSFNKSAILDIENMLITHMHADGKFILQNSNGGQSKSHNYYQRSLYKALFEDLWIKLQNHNLVNHSLFEVENSDIFKFSPYKELTSEQYKVVEELLDCYVHAMKSENQIKVVVDGGAGTGKSLIAVYFVNMIANILNNNYDCSDTDELLDDESLFSKAQLIKDIKTYGNDKIAFVIAVPAFKDSVKKIFNSIKELKHIDVISPSEASRGDYDVLIVDEAHRLKRRNKLTNYGTHDHVNRTLGLPLDATELDWLKLKANKILILFYDSTQSVKESDVKKEDFDLLLDEENVMHRYLTAQLRVKGGNEYIDFIHNLFTSNPTSYFMDSEYDFKVYDDCHQMFEDIKDKDKQYNGLCRVISGLSFYWRKKARDKKSTKYKQDFDFEIDGYKYNWNEDFNAGDFISKKENIDKVGCIYTVQGHDLNYAGVIFGEDISYNPVTKQIEYNIDKFIDTNSISKDKLKTIKNITNAYLVLLTRGVYGTYVYAVDKNLRDYIKSFIRN